MSADHCSTSCCPDKSKKQIHVAIIGSGSAAFACAIKAAENGARVTMIEGADIIGGCCVNVGCVPSKILIRAAQLAQQQRNNPFAGLENHTPQISRALLAHQQSSRVEELRQAKYQNILESNPALTLLKGYASFSKAEEQSSTEENKPILNVTQEDGSKVELVPDSVLVSTGSTSTIPPIKGLTDTPFWTSTEALFAHETPEYLVVIGSSVVALEIAQAYRRLGAEVTIIARHTLLYKEDPLLGKKLTSILEKEGIKVLSNTQAEEVTYSNNMFTLSLNVDRKAEHIRCDQLLACTGRHANTSKLNLDSVGIATDNSGAIIVNERMETSLANVYAAGDCSNMPQFVYVAAAAGSRAGINMTGGDTKLDLSTMPAVIFTDPQVATVGLTEAQAINRGIDVQSRVLGMENVPRALVNFETDGFIKLVTERKSGRIIGAQILAHEGGELIQSAALAISNKMTVLDLANQLFPYLTMVEGLKLCAQTFYKDVKELSCCAG